MSHPDLKPRQVVVIAPPQSRRVLALQNTLAGLNWPAAKTISYVQVMQDDDVVVSALESDCILRLDSPGEDLATERLLLALGGHSDADLCAAQIAALDLEQGRLMPTRQWYCGFNYFMSQLHRQLPAGATRPYQQTWQHEQVLAMFDKRVTQNRFLQAGLAIPGFLPTCNDYQQLRHEMKAKGWRRVFIKLAHGSSATGTIALEVSREKIQATTTIHMSIVKNELRLYNSRQLLRYRDEGQIARLFDFLALNHPLQIERWLPKMGMENRAMDLRVLVTRGKATHVLVRLGNGCITNLHLRGDRGNLDQLIARLGNERYQALLSLAEQGFACFPGALYAGLDVLVTTSGQFALLEANAFGDYHRQIFYRGLDTYATQLLALQEHA
ncbi:STM4014 family protein [Serratia fonticola]